MSYRELWVFIQYLPQDSWTQTILRDRQVAELINPSEPAGGQKFGPWALINYQMAELTNAINRVWYATAVGKFDKIQPIDPVPQPGRRKATRLQSDAAVVYLDRLRARG